MACAALDEPAAGDGGLIIRPTNRGRSTSGSSSLCSWLFGAGLRSAKVVGEDAWGFVTGAGSGGGRDSVSFGGGGAEYPRGSRAGNCDTGGLRTPGWGN